MKSMKKFMALALALVMVFALSANAFAATNDPDLTAAVGTDWSYIATRDDYVVLQACPAIIGRNQYALTSFSSDEDAEAVVWSVVDGSPDGISVIYTGASLDAADHLVAEAWVYIDEFAEIGTASIEAVNPATNASVNFTITVDDGNNTSASGVKYKFYDGTTLLVNGTAGINVSMNEFYDSTPYANIYDVITAAAGIAANHLSANIGYYPGGYEALNSVTIGTNTYAYEYDPISELYTSWFYRVYDAQGNMLDTSAYVSMDAFMLQDGYTVVFMYGPETTVTFPASV